LRGSGVSVGHWPQLNGRARLRFWANWGTRRVPAWLPGALALSRIRSSVLLLSDAVA